MKTRGRRYLALSLLWIGSYFQVSHTGLPSFDKRTIAAACTIAGGTYSYLWSNKRATEVEREVASLPGRCEELAGQDVNIVVFICGASLPFLAGLDPLPVLFHRRISDWSPHRMLVKKWRNCALMKSSGWPYLGDGMHYIPLLDGGKSSLSARHIATGLEGIYRGLDVPHLPRVYFTFGASSLLSSVARTEDATQLYEDLEHLRELYGPSSRITLFTHSYGGRVALELAAQNQKKEKNLYVDEVLLFGTPLQRDVLKLLDHNAFGELHIFFSEGDATQLQDFLSGTGANYRTLSEMLAAPEFSEPIDSQLQKTLASITVNEYRLVVDENSTYFDHDGPWVFGHPRGGFAHLGPLPVSILAPILIENAHMLTVNQDALYSFDACFENRQISTITLVDRSTGSSYANGDFLEGGFLETIKSGYNDSYHFFTLPGMKHLLTLKMLLGL